MRDKTFFIICVSVLFFCVAGYFIATDRIAIADRTVESSYKQFLLKASSPIKGRIIIAGGSSSMHGIDAGMMERHFARLAINIADNATYPLEHKIYNLGNYVTREDLIILPLEWEHYISGNRLVENYVTSILDKSGSNSFYYRELPFFVKVRFIFKDIPFSLALNRIVTLNGLSWFNGELRKAEADSLEKIFNLLSQDLRGSDLGDTRMNADVGTQSCDEYVMRDTFIISEQFKKDLKLLQAMVKKTNAKVVFTWPTVTDMTNNECYTSNLVQYYIDSHIKNITDEVNRHGFNFIGNVYDSRFDGSCFKDTYYHVRHHCAIDRTARLIELLESEGLLTKRDGYSPDSTSKILGEYARNIEASFGSTVISAK